MMLVGMGRGLFFASKKASLLHNQHMQMNTAATHRMDG